MSFLETICADLQNEKITYALVGGHAVALHGAVRGTVDIDFVIKWNQETLNKIETLLGKHGLISRLPVSSQEIFAFRDEYIKNRNLVAWNFYHPDDATKLIDIIITYDLNPKHIKRFSTPTTTISVLNIKQLIAMKKEVGRAQDLEDIKALEKILKATRK